MASWDKGVLRTEWQLPKHSVPWKLGEICWDTVLLSSERLGPCRCDLDRSGSRIGDVSVLVAAFDVNVVAWGNCICFVVKFLLSNCVGQTDSLPVILQIYKFIFMDQLIFWWCYGLRYRKLLTVLLPCIESVVIHDSWSSRIVIFCALTCT